MNRSLLLLPCCLVLASAFYLPGLAPVNYCQPKKASDTCKVSLHRIHSCACILG